MRRVPQCEVLDRDTLSLEAAAESLGDLRMVNRWFGGVSTTAYLLRRSMQRCNLQSASVLEVAAGDGYSIVQAAERLQRENLHIQPVCLDRRKLRDDCHCCRSSVVGDALALPFATETFDFVSCGLFLHHLAPEQAVEFVNGALGVARQGVLINDLRRSPLHLALVHAGTLMMRSPISRIDGIASVRQAYTPAELQELLALTDASASEIHLRYLFRMGAVVWK